MAPTIQTNVAAVPTSVGAPSNAAPHISSASKDSLATALAPIQKAEIKVDLADLQKNLSQSVERLNQMMRQSGRNISFAIDPSLEVPIITIKNEETGEVIRQIPNEVVVQVAHSVDALKGLLHNTKI
jgi:flagellar protein FlaG